MRNFLLNLLALYVFISTSVAAPFHVPHFLQKRRAWPSYTLIAVDGSGFYATTTLVVSFKTIYLPGQATDTNTDVNTNTNANTPQPSVITQTVTAGSGFTTTATVISTTTASASQNSNQKVFITTTVTAAGSAQTGSIVTATQTQTQIKWQTTTQEHTLVEFVGNPATTITKTAIRGRKYTTIYQTTLTVTNSVSVSITPQVAVQTLTLGVGNGAFQTTISILEVPAIVTPGSIALPSSTMINAADSSTSAAVSGAQTTSSLNAPPAAAMALSSLLSSLSSTYPQQTKVPEEFKEFIQFGKDYENRVKEQDSEYDDREREKMVEDGDESNVLATNTLSGTWFPSSVLATATIGVEKVPFQKSWEEVNVQAAHV